MKKLKLILSILLVLGVGIVLGRWTGGGPNTSAQTGMGSTAQHKMNQDNHQLYVCPMHPTVVKDKPGNCPICGMKFEPKEGAVSTPGEKNKKAKKERKIKYWVAPMDPTYVRDKPGKSPMGMDLVPVYEDEDEGGSEEGVIKINGAVTQNIGVRTKKVARKSLNRKIRAVGTVEVDESRIYKVNTKVSGWIEELFADYTERFVEEGESLLSLYSPELVSTQEEYLLAYRQHEKLKSSPFPDVVQSARSLMEASRVRLAYWDISDDQVARLERSGIVRKTLEFYSPVTGYILHKNAVEGTFVKAGTDLFTIADLSTVWVIGEIYEFELPWVKEGQMVEIENPYDPEGNLLGRIDYIYPKVDKKTRTVKVRVTVDNEDLILRPKMFVNLSLRVSGSQETIVVPYESVLDTGKRKTVIVALGQGRFKAVPVETGLETEDEVEITSGLKGDEEIVVSAQFMLDSESRLKEALAKFLGSN